MDSIKRILSGAKVDISRVNPFGLILMAAAVAMVALADMLARKIHPEAPKGTRNTIKIIGLVICAGGALLAILG